MTQILINELDFTYDGYSVTGQINVGQNSSVSFKTKLTEEESDELERLLGTIRKRLQDELRASFVEDDEE